MEIDPKELRETLLWLIDLIYAARKDLIAHGVAAMVLKQAGLAEEFDQVLQQTRQHPSPALLADHQKIRDTIEALLREEKADTAMTFLRSWQPKGPIQ